MTLIEFAEKTIQIALVTKAFDYALIETENEEGQLLNYIHVLHFEFIKEKFKNGSI